MANAPKGTTMLKINAAANVILTNKLMILLSFYKVN